VPSARKHFKVIILKPQNRLWVREHGGFPKASKLEGGSRISSGTSELLKHDIL
jgi:hypothetical protein